MPPFINDLMNQLTPTESSALIWAFMGLVAILVAIGWYYIQSSIKSQKEMNTSLFNMRLNQADHNKDLASIKEDMQEMKEDMEVLHIRQNEFDKELTVIKSRR